MITNVGLFIAVAAVAAVICFFFVLGSVLVGVLRTARVFLINLLFRRGPRAAGGGGGWSARSQRICVRAGCGRANVREAKYCAQCGQRLDG